MDMSFSTPALLFPAISLLFISYTNRFVAYAQLVRGLYERWETDHEAVVLAQIENLRRRIGLIRNMQLFGGLSLLAAASTMVLLFFALEVAADIAFVGSLALLVFSMALLVYEVTISIQALNLQLEDMQRDCRE